jgi:preprotein translocase subunit SecA
MKITSLFFVITNKKEKKKKKKQTSQICNKQASNEHMTDDEMQKSTHAMHSKMSG